MTRLIHDKFAKDYFESLLEPFGQINSQKRVSAEDQYIDVWFEPAQEHLRELNELGGLGRMATTPSMFEPYRNPVTPEQIGDCLLKLLLIKAEMKRQARRKESSLAEESVPKLWILTPTASSTVLSGFNALQTPDELEGFYTLGSSLSTNIIVIHQLPRTSETLWLRVLGRDRVQKEAIDELEALSENNPFRQRALELLYTLQKSLKSKQDIEPEDRELIMRLEPLYQIEREQRDREIKQEIATNLHSMGMGIEQIAQATGLSPKQVMKLINQNSDDQ
ncbi:hypothetical protein [Dactylococcopsis salina]|uniref:Flagellar assembly protein H n=1 Tax=Dactylococcopsis salina (strain PCC 8305) TaxID=13035 RepID=K9YU11_DACS8|nr:hypothetical protein [Dactylococcopsis salina]AFZ49598.1 hypothetical protein Dacsa_0853 [Dactylococcopsis salina PCC 8305]